MKSRPKRKAKPHVVLAAATLLPLKILLVPDTHVPYEDPKAWAIMFKAAATLNNGAGPDAVVVMGDFFDCFELSTHEKDLRSRGGLETELEAAAARLTQLEALVEPNYKAERAVKLYAGTTDDGYMEPTNNTRCFYLLGNHENRIYRAMQRDQTRGFLKAYLGAGVLQQRSLLEAMGMDGPPWHEIPYMQTLYLGNNAVQPKIALTHDLGKAGMNAHHDAARVFGAMHSAIGHTHRLASATHKVNGVGYTSHMLGWLGDARQQSYMPAVKMEREWSHGFGVATIGVGHCGIQAIPIQQQWDGTLSCCVDGKIVTG